MNIKKISSLLALVIISVSMIAQSDNSRFDRDSRIYYDNYYNDEATDLYNIYYSAPQNSLKHHYGSFGYDWKKVGPLTPKEIKKINKKIEKRNKKIKKENKKINKEIEKKIKKRNKNIIKQEKKKRKKWEKENKKIRKKREKQIKKQRKKIKKIFEWW